MNYNNKTLYICATIHARSGSKGLRNKNFRKFCGKPLIFYSINIAKSIKRINKVIVSTDSKKIAKISKKFKSDVCIRPKHLAHDKADIWKSWQHLMKFLKKKDQRMPDLIVDIPTTSPLRNIKDINGSINKFLKNKKSDMLLTVVEARRNPYFNMVKINKKGFLDIVISPKQHIYNRQKAPEIFDVCTLAYITTPKYILKNSHMFKGNVDYYKVDKSRSVDIDDLDDFNLAEIMYRNRNRKKNVK